MEIRDVQALPTVREVRRWWICFYDDGKRAGLFHRLTASEGFAHVLAVAEPADGITVTINPIRSHCAVQLFDCSPIAILRQVAAAPHSRILFVDRAELPPLPGEKILPRAPLVTCASYLAYTIGLPFRGVTPRQLYEALRAHGFTGVDVGSDQKPLLAGEAESRRGA